MDLLDVHSRQQSRWSLVTRFVAVTILQSSQWLTIAQPWSNASVWIVKL